MSNSQTTAYLFVEFNSIKLECILRLLRSICTKSFREEFNISFSIILNTRQRRLSEINVNPVIPEKCKLIDLLISNRSLHNRLL